MPQTREEKLEKKRAHYREMRSNMSEVELAAQRERMRKFYQNNKHLWTSDEKRAKDAAYRSNNKPKLAESARNRRRSLRDLVYEVKRAPCVDCGGTWPPYVMDLDHIGGKESDVSSLVDAGASIKRIKEEISKCEVVCSNCHRIRTHTRRGTIA